jgi:hypothetical protein
MFSLNVFSFTPKLILLNSHRCCLFPFQTTNPSSSLTHFPSTLNSLGKVPSTVPLFPFTLIRVNGAPCVSYDIVVNPTLLAFTSMSHFRPWIDLIYHRVLNMLLYNIILKMHKIKLNIIIATITRKYLRNVDILPYPNIFEFLFLMFHILISE